MQEHSNPPSNNRTSKLELISFAIVLVGTVTYWLILVWRVPLNEYIPHWFWVPTTAPRPNWWLIFLIIGIVIGCVFFIQKTSFYAGINILVLIITGFIIQHTFALMEGRGIDGIRDRMIHTGHSVFATETVKQLGDKRLLFVARNYQNLIEDGTLSIYPTATKPPGHILFYMLTNKLSRRIFGEWNTPLHRLTTFASLFWPLLSYLPILPIYLLSKLFINGKLTYVPSILYLSIPSVTLITLHLDQCLYPLLFISALTSFIYGVVLRNATLIVLAGMISSLSVFISFSLVIVPVFILLILLLERIKSLLPMRPENAPSVDPILTSNAKFFLYSVGFVAVNAILFFLLNYNLLTNYLFILSNHQTFKITDWSIGTTVYVGWLDILEFALWVGLPLFSLSISHAIRAFRKITAQNDIYTLSASAYLLVLFGLAFFGRTVAETARLWLFLTPLVVIFAGSEITLLFRRSPWNAVMFLALIQTIYTFVIKMWQDFL
jgi:hypothetical protein